MSITSINMVPETIRELGFAAIGAGYVSIGTPLDKPSSIIILMNLTDETLMFSFDGVNDHLALPANGHLTLDITANKTNQAGALFYREGGSLYVKQIGVPTSGSVYLTSFYAK